VVLRSITRQSRETKTTINAPIKFFVLEVFKFQQLSINYRIQTSSRIQYQYSGRDLDRIDLMPLCLIKFQWLLAIRIFPNKEDILLLKHNNSECP